MTQTAPAPGAMVPFIDGTYEYSEIISTTTVTPGATAVDLPAVNIIPGGFLRGISIYVTSTGGSLGTGTVSPDNPWSLFNSLTLESIDGTPILYPMDGYAHYIVSRYARPWDGDPALDPNFVSGINPQFRLSFFCESRATLGVLPNTDARAQYRVRMTINPLTNAQPAGGLLTAVGTATPPTVTITVALETYAQPPATSLSQQPIQQVPDGVGMQRFVSRQIDATVAGTMTVKENRTGNLIRTHMLIVRDTNGIRIDLTADPIRQRVDNTQLFVEQRNRRDYFMWKFFNMQSAPGVAAAVRPTGVYVFPRWQDPGFAKGVGWLESTEATFLQFELNGAPAGGQLQTITEDLAPVAMVPAYLENI